MIIQTQKSVVKQRPFSTKMMFSGIKPLVVIFKTCVRIAKDMKKYSRTVTSKEKVYKMNPSLSVLSHLKREA